MVGSGERDLSSGVLSLSAMTSMVSESKEVSGSGLLTKNSFSSEKREQCQKIKPLVFFLRLKALGFGFFVEKRGDCGESELEDMAVLSVPL